MSQIQEPIYFVNCLNGHRYRGKIRTLFASSIPTKIIEAKFLFGFIPIRAPQLVCEEPHYECKMCGAQLISEEGIVDGKQVMGCLLMPEYYNKETKLKLNKKRGKKK